MSSLMLKAAGVISATLLSLTACASSENTGSDGNSTTRATNTVPKTYGSVTDLRDAAVETGYVCNDWVAENEVVLAAESANCDDSSVLSIYASQADLQSQLDQEKTIAKMSTDVGLETTPILVGENWLFKAPEAADLRAELGGVLIGAKQ